MMTGILLWRSLMLIHIVINNAYAPSTTLDHLLQQSKENNGVIYGNPLLTKKCATVLLDEHQHNIGLLQQKGLPTPWFFSRESLDATTNDLTLHRRAKITHLLPPNPPFIAPWSNTIANEYSTDHKNMSEHITRWYLENAKDSITKEGNTYSDDYRKTKRARQWNIFYYHIEKSGSSTIRLILDEMGFETSFVSENWRTSTKCGFTFVRDPIDRFISGYYTVNRLIYERNIPGKYIITYAHPYKYKWYNISNEPQRFTQFVDDLMQHRFAFVKDSPLEHIMSQTAILSVTQSDIHFIGRLNKLKQHWHELYDFCNSNNHQWQRLHDQIEDVMVHFGVEGFNRTKDMHYLEMMDLVDWKSGDLLPPYMAIANNYDLYHKLISYYKQDYICFGFQHDFKQFRCNVYHNCTVDIKWDT
eukprot:103082_1